MMKRFCCLLLLLLAVGSAGIGHTQTLAARYDLALDSTFQKAVRVAMVETAIAIIGEPTRGKVAVDDKRHALAFDVLHDTDQFLLRFAVAVAADPTASLADDASIRNRTSAIWDKLARVRGNEPNNPAPGGPGPDTPGPP